MLPRAPSRLLLGIVTFGLWLLAAASLAYWVLRLGNPAGGPAVAAVMPAPAPAPDTAAVSHLLGARRAAGGSAPADAPSAGSRFLLAGVIAGRGTGGAALISVDGKPAKPFRVGSVVDTGLVLQSVAARRAVLAAAADAPPSLTLELPQPKR